MTEKKHVTASGAMGHIFRKQIFIPIAALLLLVVFNLALDPSFFKITLGRNSGAMLFILKCSLFPFRRFA